MTIAIIGAGLSGLSLASQLQKHNIDFQIFEARERPGGRIFSHNGKDLGPTWFWPQENTALVDLLKQLDLTSYPQWSEGYSLYQANPEQPPQKFLDSQSYHGAHKIHGGAQKLIDGLLVSLTNKIAYKHKLKAAQQSLGGVKLTFDHATHEKPLHFKASKIVLCVPPRLISRDIEFSPKLDPRLNELMQDTPTWMAGQAKAMAYFPHNFWRPYGISGNGFSQSQNAILGEFFDATEDSGSKPALGAFFAMQARERHEQQQNLENLTRQHLAQIFGDHILSSGDIYIKDWSLEPLTSTERDWHPITSHPQYGHPWFDLDHWQDKLFFCGSETSTQFGGYMEGALLSAERTSKSILLSRESHSCQT